LFLGGDPSSQRRHRRLEGRQSIIGPIIAALFSAVWEIYGVVFGDVLPPITATGSTPSKEEIRQQGAPPEGDSKDKLERF
jgi:hypothetical protein